jgi:hypothetical protein
MNEEITNKLQVLIEDLMWGFIVGKVKGRLFCTHWLLTRHEFEIQV